MSTQLFTVKVNVQDPTADAVHVEQLTGLLRQELLALDVEDVRQPTIAEAPSGAKSGGIVELGTLLVTLVKSGGLLSQIGEMVRSWVTRDERLTVSLEVGDAKIVVSGASEQERRQLIDAWVQRALTQELPRQDVQASDGEVTEGEDA